MGLSERNFPVPALAQPFFGSRLGAVAIFEGRPFVFAGEVLLRRRKSVPQRGSGRPDRCCAYVSCPICGIICGFMFHMRLRPDIASIPGFRVFDIGAEVNACAEMGQQLGKSGSALLLGSCARQVPRSGLAHLADLSSRLLPSCCHGLLTRGNSAPTRQGKPPNPRAGCHGN